MSVRSDLDRPALHSATADLVAASFSRPLRPRLPMAGESYEAGGVSIRVYGSSATGAERSMVDAVRHAVADGLRGDRGGICDGDVGGCARGVVVILRSEEPAMSVQEWCPALVGTGDVSGVAGRAVGLIVVGADARTAAVEIREFGDAVRCLGGHVVGTGLFVDSVRTAMDRGPTARFTDPTLASSLSLMGRRVEVLAAAGRTLRAR